MTRYRIHRMKPSAREAFRWAAHTGGTATVKEKDYEASAEIEAAGVYAAWKALASSEDRLEPGDLLADENGKLVILKYIGFEPAAWFVPEPKPIPPGVLEAGPVLLTAQDPQPAA